MTSRRPPSQRDPEAAVARISRALQSMSPGTMGGRVANAAPISVRSAEQIRSSSAYGADPVPGDGGNDSSKAPGETLDDGSAAAATPSTLSLTIPPLTVTTGVEQDVRGVVRAWVRAVWSAPPQGEHPTDPNRVGEYQIQYTDRIQGYSPSATSEVRDVTVRHLPVQADVDVRVRARTNLGVLGPWTTGTVHTQSDSVPPPVPSTPTIKGTVRGAAFAWDGLFAGGELPPADYQYVEAQFSLDPTFAADASTIASEKLAGAGTTAVYQLGVTPFTVYARLRSMDTSGNYSGWSAVASSTGIKIIPADVGEGAITAESLADAAVTARSILDGAVTAFGLARSAVTTEKLADLAITTAKIGDRAIDGIKLGLSAVVTENLGPGAVSSAKLADLAVTSAKVAESAITLGKIGPNAVDNLALLDGSVQTNSIAQSAITSSLLAQFAVQARNVGFGIGGGNMLENASFEDGLNHWAPENSTNLVLLSTGLVHGSKSVECTFDPVYGHPSDLS